ncbi:hypothetical protein [Paludibacterium sp.]|nr:hypothetical protein [Paludibacterium sp.]MBV8649611.1 hypothetical protein [Paludibacterium sp.]
MIGMKNILFAVVLLAMAATAIWNGKALTKQDYAWQAHASTVLLPHD